MVVFFVVVVVIVLIAMMVMMLLATSAGNQFQVLLAQFDGLRLVLVRKTDEIRVSVL